MKSDLDQLMTQHDFAALIVTGGTGHNPSMYYLANGAHVGEATILMKKRGEAPVIFANSMERDEAAKSGLRVIDQSKYDILNLIKEEKGNRTRATARMFGKMFEELGIAGRVAVFGLREQGAALSLWSAVAKLNPGITIGGPHATTLLETVTATKDADEVRRIRAVGKKTMAVVGGAQEFITAHRAKGGYLMKKDGKRLTVGDVKARINVLLMEQGIVDAEGGTIFAIGRDAGVPHSRGNARDPIALGKSIVFDIFPAEMGGGYFYDFTRTWCVGYAPDHVLQAYEDVKYAYDTVKKALKPNESCRVYQKMTCDIFEARGHPTVQSNPQTTSGYVHSLAHGVGLHIHEVPSFRDVEGATDTVAPGVVFTWEPGLYYPDHPQGGFGVRLEDAIWLNPATLKFETLAKYPYDLVLKVK